MVAKPLCPLYKNIIKPLDRARYPELRYYPIWQAMQNDEELTAVVRSRQLHIYRNGKKILILAGKAQPKIIREDKLNELIIIK